MTVMRATGSYGTNKWLSGYVNNRVIIPTEEEKQLFKEFMHQTLLRPQSSEKAGNRILAYGAWARIPLFLVLQEQTLKVPIQFLFGDDDWIHNKYRNDGSVERLLTEGFLHADSRYHIVERSGHHVYIDNFKRVAGYILDFCEGQEVADNYLILSNYEF